MPARTKNSPSPKKKRTASIEIPRGVRITHPERVVYPDDGITKGDVAAYYLAVAERMLPYVVHRPLSLVRCPDGIAKSCFFQKHPPPGMSQAVDRIPIREKSGLDTYVAIHDLAGLLSLVQFNAMEIHVWGSLVDDVERPDRIVFDLDPGPGVAWKEVVAAAMQFRRLLKKLGLASFVKTTGGKGLHVAAPIRPKRKWDEIKAFCRGVAETIERTAPSRFVTNMSKAKRNGKIFLDYLRNDRGATWVAPYSTRARAGAPISMPIEWSELTKLKSAHDFTLENAPRRLKSRRADAWRGIGKAARPLTDAMFRAVVRP